jgi:DNA-3-methyladenine glycosylase II
MTPAEYDRARRVLMKRDPKLRAVIAKHGACGLTQFGRTDAFATIVESIVSQQLSTRAAATIHRRVCELFPAGLVTPLGLLTLDEDALRRAGLSRPKIGYMRDLSRKVLDGSLELDRLDEMADEQVIEELTRVKGIGRWSAEMMLIFRLQRPDVLPVDDLGIVNAIQRVYGLRKRPSRLRVLEIGERWRPYRSVACWYLWASLENEPGPIRDTAGKLAAATEADEPTA